VVVLLLYARILYLYNIDELWKMKYLQGYIGNTHFKYSMMNQDCMFCCQIQQLLVQIAGMDIMVPR